MGCWCGGVRDAEVLEVAKVAEMAKVAEVVNAEDNVAEVAEVAGRDAHIAGEVVEGAEIAVRGCGC